jgi:hypothetical protein
MGCVESSVNLCQTIRRLIPEDSLVASVRIATLTKLIMIRTGSTSHGAEINFVSQKGSSYKKLLRLIKYDLLPLKINMFQYIYTQCTDNRAVLLRQFHVSFSPRSLRFSARFLVDEVLEKVSLRVSSISPHNYHPTITPYSCITCLLRCAMALTRPVH